MPELVSLLAVLGSAAVAATVWFVRLEGRVNVLDQRFLDLKELIEQRFDAIDARLERIERHVLNGS